MISIAWSISLLLCVPQAFIFEGGDDKCQANFAPDWGVKGYVTWFSISNFFLPLCFLLFCYTRICYDIWENGKLKMKEENGQKKPKKKGYFRHWKNCVKRQRGVPTTVTIHQDNQTIVVEDPDAITAFEKLKRKASDASSDDSSIESADRNMLNVRKSHFKTILKTLWNIKIINLKSKNTNRKILLKALLNIKIG